MIPPTHPVRLSQLTRFKLISGMHRLRVTPWRVLFVLTVGALLSSPGLATASAAHATKSQYSPPTPPSKLNALLRQAHVRPSEVAVMVRDATTGHVKLDWNSETLLLPASTEKLVTTLAAYHLNGPEYHFKTTLVSNALIVNQTLEGDLWVVGGNDPFLTRESLQTLVSHLATLNIKKIRGEVHIDRSLVQVADEDVNAFDGEGTRAYNVLADAFTVDFGLLTIHVERQALANPVGPLASPATSAYLKTTGPAIRAELIGAGSIPIDVGQLRQSSMTCDGGSRLGINPNASGAVLTGTLNLACLPIARTGALVDRRLQSAWLLQDAFKQAGIEFNGLGSDSKAPINAKRLAVLESPTLREIIGATNRFSNNVMARQIFLSIQQQDNDQLLTVERSRGKVHAWLKQLNLCSDIVIDNGSGLSRQSRLSMHCLNDLLWHEQVDGHAADFRELLATPQEKGTLHHRLKGLEQRAWLKTGHLTGVDGIAGWVIDNQGHYKIVSVMINRPKLNRVLADAWLDSLLIKIANNQL